MDIQQKKSFIAPFFSFHFITISGIIIALFVYMISTESRPISYFLFAPNLYLLSTLVAVAVRVLLWVLVDKGTFFEIGRLIGRLVRDVIIINVVILSMLSSIFIAETYFF